MVIHAGRPTHYTRSADPRNFDDTRHLMVILVPRWLRWLRRRRPCREQLLLTTLTWRLLLTTETWRQLAPLFAL